MLKIEKKCPMGKNIYPVAALFSDALKNKFI
jgi:hypothetical protein